jgi:hypothetical protein
LANKHTFNAALRRFVILHRFNIVFYELSNIEKIEILQQVAILRKSQREAFFPKTEIEASCRGTIMTRGWCSSTGRPHTRKGGEN